MSETAKRYCDDQPRAFKRHKGQAWSDRHELERFLGSLGVNLSSSQPDLKVHKDIMKALNFLQLDDRSQFLKLIRRDGGNLEIQMRFISSCLHFWEQLKTRMINMGITITDLEFMRLVLEEDHKEFTTSSIDKSCAILVELYEVEGLNIFLERMNSTDFHVAGPRAALIINRAWEYSSRISTYVWRPLLKIIEHDPNLIVLVSVSLFVILNTKCEIFKSREGSLLVLSAIKEIVAHCGSVEALNWDINVFDFAADCRLLICSLSEPLLHAMTSAFVDRELKIWSSLRTINDQNILKTIKRPSHVKLFCLILTELPELIHICTNSRLSDVKNDVFDNLKMIVPNRSFDYRPIFLECVNFITEKDATNICELLESAHTKDQRLCIFADTLLSLSQLSAKTNSLDNITILDPIKAPLYKANGFCEIAYPDLLGLRGNSLKGPSLPKMIAYVRPCITACFEKLQDALCKRNYADLEGPPGIGKSISIALWSQVLVGMGMSVCWVSMFEDDGAKVIIMRPNVVIDTQLTQKELQSVMEGDIHCDITVLDGITRTNSVSIVHSCIRSSDRKLTKVIFCRSEGSCLIKESVSLSLTGWTLDEYRTALNNAKFMKQYTLFFSEDNELFATPQNKLTRRAIERIISSKFEVAGGNARYFFAFGSQQVKDKIDNCLMQVIGNVQEESLRAVNIKVFNSIFTRVGRFESDFVSSYAATRFVDLHTENHFKTLWKHSKELGRGAVGSAFQRLTEKLIKSKQSLKVLREGVKLEEWPVNDYSAYYNSQVFPSSDSARIAIQSGFVKRVESKFSCSVCAKFAKSFEAIARHVTQKHMSSIAHDPVVFRENALRVLESPYIEALELIDISDKFDDWILTSKVNEKVLDMLRIVNRNEAWMLQLTISDTHNICDYDYIDHIRKILRYWLPDSQVNFGVLVPRNRKFSFTAEQKTQLEQRQVPYSWFSIDDGPLALLDVD